MPGETFNIGGENEISNIQIVETICEILDNEIPSFIGESYKNQIAFVDDRPGHDFRYAINASKIKNKLGWQPEESFETGIKKTVVAFLKKKTWCEKIQKLKYNQQRLGLIQP